MFPPRPRAAGGCRRRAPALLLATAWLVLPAWAGAQALSVAEPGFPTGFVLEKFSARASAVAAKALAEPSLVASKSVRELQVLIATARLELRDATEERWDKLPAPQQALLREIDRALQSQPVPAADRGRIEQPVVLDMAPSLARLSLSPNTPVLRRVEGASQYYRASGSYRLRLESNLPALGATGFTLTIAGQPVPAGWLSVSPPGSVQVTIPAAALADSFSERTLVHLPLELVGVMPVGSWKFWQSNSRAVAQPFALELFPKKPFTFTLKESTSATSVDESQVLFARGRPQPVPGCGSPGCVRDQNVCNEVPAGAKPLEPVNFSDSAVDDPAGAWTAAVAPQPNGFCVVYKQQSPQRARQVSFDIRYHPASTTPKLSDRPVRREGAPATAPPEAEALELGTRYSGELSREVQAWELVLKAFTGQTLRATASSKADSALLQVAPPQREADRTRLPFSVQPPW
ncbi:MAG: hypothetical protein HY855_16480 [Burkholderiales bacterium]|nr:hypothetical protein [Burkholderiales bacterium]